MIHDSYIHRKSLDFRLGNGVYSCHAPTGLAPQCIVRKSDLLRNLREPGWMGQVIGGTTNDVQKGGKKCNSP